MLLIFIQNRPLCYYCEALLIVIALMMHVCGDKLHVKLFHVSLLLFHVSSEVVYIVCIEVVCFRRMYNPLLTD